MDPDIAQEGSSFKMPSITNPPPQIFGQFDTVSYEANYFPENDGFDATGSLDESNDAKRRRIARACDACRRKKIKCDGKQPACSHCINYKTECIFTTVEKKRNPPKGAKYIEGLENRLERMETLLRMSGLLSEEDGTTDLGTLEKKLADKAASDVREVRPDSSSRRSNSVTRGPDSNVPSRQSPMEDTAPDQPNGKKTPPMEAKENKPSEDVEHLSDMMCSLVTNNYGDSRYIGSSSGFSIFSPKGIQWVNEKTGDISFQQMISAAAVNDRWTYWKPDVFGDIFARRKYVPLPPQQETLSLLKDYFDNFNCMFPLFHEPTFMHLVQRHYSKDPYHGSGWWASLNVALAIAHRLRVMSNLVPQEEDSKAWSFLKNALGVYSELTLRNTDLLSVKHSSECIGLHKRGSGFRLNPVEVEQRKRVFWIAYMLDKDICIRSGRPPAQDDDDMSVELPSEDPGDNIGNVPLADGKGKTNLFRQMCTFAVIESKVYRQLYSTKASKQSEGELLNTIGELDKELEGWKDNIPLDFRPEHEIKATHTPLILHVVVLHFAYYNCLTTIHRMSVHHGYWTSRLSNYAISGLNARPLNPRVFSSAALCVQAARSSIQLVRYIPQGDFACVWMILYYPVSSLVTLFANILQNPQDARSRSDLRLMSQVVNFLTSLAEDDDTGGVKRMHDFCSEFERIAKLVIDKSDKKSHSRRKRKSIKDPTDEPIPPLVSSTKRPSPLSPGVSSIRSPKTAASDMVRPGFTNDMLAAPYSSGYPSPDSNGTPTQDSLVSPHISPSSAATVPLLPPAPPIPDFMPGPGDFPNMLTDFSDMQSFGHPGLRDGGIGIAGMGALPTVAAAAMDPNSATATSTAAFAQGFPAQDVWQMPMMSFDYDWTNMQLDPLVPDSTAGNQMPDFDEQR